MRRLVVEAGLAATCGNEITKLYGLTTRTRTAVINASILPKMIDTAVMTEASVREAGIQAPLMIMRGDGGVMDIAEMRRRPVMTMLSGPAASVAGALMYLRVSDGIYFEVGGTSTNIGVIRNGRPTVKYARVGGHETYVSSLDVRVIGIAGGSMVRARDGKLVDVGPRSAHIAGLALCRLCRARGHRRPHDRVLPAEGRRSRRLCRGALGQRHPLCHHQHLRRQRARLRQARIARLWQPEVGAARHGGTRRHSSARSIEDTARAILDIATDKVIPVVDDLIAEYKLDRDQAVLVGEGGGAAALIPHASSRTGLHHEISKDAEVISSIGVALALVRDVVERVIPNPTARGSQAHSPRGVRGRGQARRGSGECRSDDRGRSRIPIASARPRWAPRKCAPASARTRSARSRPGNRGESDGRRAGACDARRCHAAHARFPGRSGGAILGNIQEAPQPGSCDRSRRRHPRAAQPQRGPPGLGRNRARWPAAAVGRHDDLQWRQHHHAGYFRRSSAAS